MTQLALAVGSLGVLAGCRTHDASSVALGSRIGDIALLTLRGDTATTSRLLDGTPSLLIVAGAEDCWSCSDYAFQMRLVRERTRLRTILVGSGPDTASVQQYIRTNKLEEYAYLDPNRSLLTSLGLTREPVAVVVDDRRRVLFVDPRGSRSMATAPIGVVLSDLEQSMRPRP